MSKVTKPKLPIIYYEEPENGGYTNPIPYIEMEKEDVWPTILFIHEYRLTGEFEPDSRGNAQPIMEATLHQYVDMGVLKEKISAETYDIVRIALGMKPLKEAQEAGSKLLDKVEQNISKEKQASKNKEPIVH